MEGKKQIKPFLEYTDEEGRQVFSEGDCIICRAKDGRRYIGRIIAICGYQESEDADLGYAIYLNTSQDKMSYSGQIIKIEDITYMCKNPANDLLNYPQTNEKQDRSRFINMIVGLGHEKEKAEIMYGHMKKLIALYNIPLSSVLHDVIQEVSLDADGKFQDELTEIYNKLMGEVVRAFQVNTDSLRKILEEAIASQAMK